MSEEKSMSVEQKLGLNKFSVDEGNPHIVVHQENLDEATKKALTKICPAGLYTLNDKNDIVFEFAGCLECGTCRVVCGHKKGGLDWNHPNAGYGVQYRCG